MDEILSYAKLGIASLLPVIASALLYILKKNTPYKNVDKNVRSIIAGIVFGCLAIVGTEWGIPLNGAQVNCRDAAVLCAGLLFDGKAGIIAGLIGGIERWFAVYWGVGEFTRVACSVSTIIAGFIAYFLRNKMFEGKRTGWLLSFEIGVVVEVFHLTMVFLTNLNQSDRALVVVKGCSIPMIFANGLSLMLATIIVSALAKDHKYQSRAEVKISESIQTLLLIVILIALVLTMAFTYKMQDEMALEQAEKSLNVAINDLVSDIQDASDANLLRLARLTVQERDAGTSLNEIASRYDITEINVVNEVGKIVESTNKDFIGFVMGSGEQSAEFLCLLHGSTEYVQEYGPISYDTSISRKYAGVATNEGFIQIGYDAVHFQKDIADEVIMAASNRHVGQNGYLIIADEKYNVVSAPKNFSTKNIKDAVEKFDTAKNLSKNGFVIETEFEGEPSLSVYGQEEGYYVIGVLSKAEAYESRSNAMYIVTFMEILAFAFLFVIIYFTVDKVVVKNIQKVNKSLNNISEGNLNEVVDVRTNLEFDVLSNDINKTVDSLKGYIADAENRMKADLDMATNIQLSSLPNRFPAFPRRKDFDIYASMDPAKEVGGDFYDMYMTHSKYLNFLVADVSGKGIPGALFMMRAKTELQTLTKADLLIDQVFTEGNSALCEGNDAGMFVTAWQGGINLNTGMVEYANAGHNPPVVKRADGKFEYLRSKVNLVLAGMDGVKYKMQELQMNPGDIIFLYTDGITEATNAYNELYGEERLLNILNSRDFVDMHDLCDAVKEDVDKFVGEAPQFDDMTTLALQYFGSNGPKWFSLEAKIEGIPRITEFVDGWLQKMGCPLKVQMQIDVAIDEIFANIASYAYKNHGGKGRMGVVLRENNDPHGITMSFVDTGYEYNPLEHEDPDITLSAEERGIGGLGILMVKQTMDDCKYERINGKNYFTITKNFEKQE